MDIGQREPSSGRPHAVPAPSAGTGGASSVEVYGFVGWITSAVGFVIFLVWAFLPEEHLQALGVSYYPSKHWALTIPLWITLLLLYIYWAYESINMMTVPQLSSLTTIHDDKCKWCEAVGMTSAMQSTEHSIPPLVHIPAPVVSRVLYGGQAPQTAERIELSWNGAPTAAVPAPRLVRPASRDTLASAAAGGSGAGSSVASSVVVAPDAPDAAAPFLGTLPGRSWAPQGDEAKCASGAGGVVSGQPSPEISEGEVPREGAAVSAPEPVLQSPPPVVAQRPPAAGGRLRSLRLRLSGRKQA